MGSDGFLETHLIYHLDETAVHEKKVKQNLPQHKNLVNDCSAGRRRESSTAS